MTKDIDGRHARALFDNYRRLFIGDQVVGSILELAHDWQHDRQGAKARFVESRRLWETRGGFLETISCEDISYWVRDPLHILVDFPVSELRSTDDGCLKPVAQILYKVPQDDWIVPTLLSPQDKIFDRELHAEMLSAGPGASLATDYLYVLPGWTGRGLGEAVRSKGAMECASMNAGRDAHAQMRYVVGWTFGIHALEVLDPEERLRFGDILRLSSYQQGEVINRLSPRVYLTNRRVPARLLGKWQSAPPVPIVVSDKPYALHVNWYCLVQRLSDYVRASGLVSGSSVPSRGGSSELRLSV
ncbi:MAG: hypothetical protein ACT4OM_10125 [Actinomycetota bacterium]